MKTKLLILIMLIGGLGMLMPGLALAAGYSGDGHGGGWGGGGHGGGWGGGGHGGGWGRGGHGGGWGHTNYGFSFGFGYYGPGPYYYPSYYPYYYPSYYPYYPYDYSDVVVERPVIVESPPVVITQPAAPVQNYRAPAVQTSNNSADVRMKKAELLKQLASTDKGERMKAVSDLSGLSYDDEVIAKLTEILLKDPDIGLRKEVINAFARVKNQKVIFTLEGVRISDNSKEVRQAADDAIRQIREGMKSNVERTPQGGVVLPIDK